MKPQLMWAVMVPEGLFWQAQVSESFIKDYASMILQKTWEELEKEGYRCVRVEVREVERP